MKLFPLLLLIVLVFLAHLLRSEELSAVLAPAGADGSARAGGSGSLDAANTSLPPVIEEKDVLAAMTAEIVARFGLEGDLHLAFAQPWGSLRLESRDEWSLAVTQLPSSGIGSTTLVRFRIDVAGRVLGEWQTFLRAQLWKPVWVATRRLDRGTALDSSLCSVQPVDILREKQSLVPASTDLSEYEMAQTLSQERPLAWRDIQLRPLVRKGEVVEVVVDQGPLQITMKALALADAGKGERLSVRNLDSRRDFPARVVRPNTVQVDF